MKIKYRLTLYSIIFAVSIITILVTVFSIIAYDTNETEINEKTEDNILLLSSMVEHELHHYVILIEMLGENPAFLEALAESNQEYAVMDEATRIQTILDLNDEWIDASESDSMVVELLTNETSTAFSEIQEGEPDLFGEIFMTNKYGVAMATTSKLSTLKHDHKYWWQGSYNDGDSVIYFDDRGYDLSVGAVVLGVVYSIYNDAGEFQGVIKMNVKVTGMLIGHVAHVNEVAGKGEFSIVRPDGVIISKEGVLPLESSINEVFLPFLENPSTQTGQITIEGREKYFGITNIDMDNIEEDSIFGGSSSSIDHVNGNEGGEWKVIYYLDISLANKLIMYTIYLTLAISGTFIMILSILTFFFGERFTKPIEVLAVHTKELAAGKFEKRVTTNRTDEIGNLYNDFNKLSESLQHSTTSLYNLEKEIERRKKLEVELINISRVDELTQLYNRRAFNDFFEKYLHTAFRSDKNVGVILFDIDDFKLVNDTYGHQVGDKVLQFLATTISKTLRKSDIFARWGGEEFILLIPNATKEHTLEVAEKIRKVVEKYEHDNVGYITISLGVTISKENDNTDKIISRVDKAMYISKQSGKNQTTLN